MKAKTFAWLCLVLVLCSSCEGEKISPDDPSKFSTSSIVGIWACIATNNLTYDMFTGKQTYYWDYDPNAQTYQVKWYFDIKDDSHVKYMNVMNDDVGEYRREDGYLHIHANSKWKNIVDANYIFDEELQAIRCPSGKILGFTMESVAMLLGTDIIYYVRRYALDEAVIYDNTGYIQSQYVIRVKGIKTDL